MTSIVPDDALLVTVAESAAGQHLHILSNGRRTVLSPVLLDGWTEIHVRIKTPTRGVMVAHPNPFNTFHPLQEAHHASA
jgi:hypothetical protein